MSHPMTASESMPTEDHAQRLARLLERHVRALERVAASYARAGADREDLLQDFALALWKVLPSFRGEASEKTFVLRIAHNRAITFLAKRGTRNAEDVDALEIAATTGSNPQMRYEKREAQSRLVAATRALPLGHRQVVTLLLEGLSHREIADVLGTTENVVAVRASRARATMRVFLEGAES